MQRFTLIFPVVLIALLGVQVASLEDNMYVKRNTNATTGCACSLREAQEGRYVISPYLGINWLDPLSLRILLTAKTKVHKVANAKETGSPAS
jgi:hypothetical protein